MASGIVLTESFVIKDVDPDGKKFDKVSRIVCTSENGEFDLILDVNTDIYPMKVSDNFELALATTLELDGRKKETEGKYDPQLGTESKPSLMDKYDYVMYGRVYNYKVEKDRTVVYVSFGGLLMKLSGTASNMAKIDPDIQLYMLVRKHD